MGKFLFVTIMCCAAVVSMAQQVSIIYQESSKFNLDMASIPAETLAKINNATKSTSQVYQLDVYPSHTCFYYVDTKREASYDPSFPLRSILYDYITKDNLVYRTPTKAKELIFFAAPSFTAKDWRILWHESKLVLGHKTFKAVLLNDNQVTVWFTPHIPASFGPLGYGGLPGLILHLSTAKQEFTAMEVHVPGLLKSNRYGGIGDKTMQTINATEWERWIERDKYELLVD